MTPENNPVEPDKPKTVVVCGDLLWNHYLVQNEDAPKAHHEATMATVIKYDAGGAWYTTELVRRLCEVVKGTNTTILQVPARKDRPPKTDIVDDAFQMCRRFEHSPDDKKTKTWRVQSFLGCHQPEEAKDPLLVNPDEPSPDLLVIDDVGLGFGKNDRLWPSALKAGGAPKSIIYKTSVFPDGLLWKLLFSNFAHLLTVVMPIEALRARCAAISKGLSWDRTIEDVVREFEHGACTGELARCRRVIVHFGPAGAACLSRVPTPGMPEQKEAIETETDLLTGGVTLERFVYRPDELEGVWYEKHPGWTFGVSPLVAAAVARHELDSKTLPLFTALSRALGAARIAHKIGGGSEKEFIPGAAECAIQEAFCPPDKDKAKFVKDDPAKKYYSSFRHELLSRPPLKDNKAGDSDLLQDLSGPTEEYVAARAIEVVMQGPKKALEATPRVSYGKYLTADRDEMERINAVRNLIVAYRDDPKDRNPLAIGVFGPPGSGKSFAIKQLSRELLESSDDDILSYNLTQIRDTADLHRAFHQVRDRSLKSRIPLVCWDEFDATVNGEELYWLKFFLEPLQDAQFRTEGHIHPFGKAVFVFAGGTHDRFEDFDLSGHNDEAAGRFRRCKGTDFVSRLRGYVNIKGPNRERPGDTACLVRRALLLHSMLKGSFERLIQKDGGTGSRVSPGVINAFLRVKEYLHGARSLEALVKMSTVGDKWSFGPADLPSDDLLKMHVTEDFTRLVREGELNGIVLEALAEACHEAWKKQKGDAGWVPGDKTDPTANPPTHVRLRPYSELKEEWKEDNRRPARVVRAKLLEVGLAVERARARSTAGMVVHNIDTDTKQTLCAIEHDIWMRAHLLEGYEFAENTNDDVLKLHRDICPFEDVPAEDRKLDEAIIDSIVPTLDKHGYVLVKV